MENVIKKAYRLDPPVTVSCKVRPEVSRWLIKIARDNSCSVSFLVRGLLEDFYDRCLAEQELAAVRDTIPLDEED